MMQQMNVRIDSELYKNFAHVAENVGLSPSGVTKAMIRQFVANGGFVVAPALVDIPNSDTISAMNDKEIIHVGSIKNLDKLLKAA
jgi:antitoxin component of RelBE/YafQ-DinJ toxin-antitoxin module